MINKRKIIKCLKWLGNHVTLLTRILIMILALVILFNILFPMALGMMGLFLDLIKLFPLLDTTATFFGGFIFLFIIYKVFEAIAMLVIKMLEWSFRLKDKGVKRCAKN